MRKKELLRNSIVSGGRYVIFIKQLCIEAEIQKTRFIVQEKMDSEKEFVTHV